MFGQERLEQTELYKREEEQEIQEAAAELERLAAALRNSGSFEFFKDDGMRVQTHMPSRVTMNSEYVQKKSEHSVRLTFSWMEQ
ncbi:amphi-Trp domain-containing protein [Natribacillus halophilus]|uniref:Amphi-Trp domain-containing protein n=1 Tax=Natribacillus halophilus TaxID=549003 RepID=A0A1G8KKZ9_9BACI|nr:amphi-Trp domain-containing protein [Natribacillus halophilus]SDI44079.1 amphi-Trp domain-containing protein [Natribacillus halophilus]